MILSIIGLFNKVYTIIYLIVISYSIYSYLIVISYSIYSALFDPRHLPESFYHRRNRLLPMPTMRGPTAASLRHQRIRLQAVQLRVCPLLIYITLINILFVTPIGGQSSSPGSTYTAVCPPCATNEWRDPVSASSLVVDMSNGCLPRL